MKTQALTKVRHKYGFAYIARTNQPGLSSHKRPLTAIVLEDGAPLPGPANVSHDDIRNLGNGRYSFWFGEVYFSASDNSDPRANGRSYSIQYADAEAEVYRYGVLNRLLYLPLKLMHHPATPLPLKTFLMEIGHSVDSIRRLGLSFPFWSLFYWLAFIYVASLRGTKQA